MFKANILNRQYQSVLTKEDNLDIPQPSGQPYRPMQELKITTEGIRKLLQKNNPGKASGPDAISAKILKECTDEIVPLFGIIFGESLSSGKVPTDWNQANVTAIFKKRK